MQRPAFLIALVIGASAFASEKECVIAGEVVHWQADYCMYKAATDDFHNEEVQACMLAEDKRKMKSSCAAKKRYKKLICMRVAEYEPYNGSVDKCIHDKEFVGTTVRNGGV